MDWVEHAIFWHVYPLGFAGAPIRDAHGEPAPRLRRLLGWLDDAIALGTNGLILGPVFPSQTHGYDTIDHFRIDSRLGTDDDFDALIAACRNRGIRVLLDGVFSHVGRDHPDVVLALRDGPDGPKSHLFDIDWLAPGGPTPRVFEGHGGLVRLDHQAPSAIELVASVMNFWLDRGIDGWRLDAAYSVDAAFWADVLPGVRQRHPDAWFLGEVIHGDYAQFVAASGVDAVTQYELWKAIWSSIRDRNLFELDWAIKRHNGFLEQFIPNTFVGNHDVTRIASAVGPQHAVVALAILLTVGGIPSIYYGDERGLPGIKQDREGGDDEVRPEFPDSPDQLATGTNSYRIHQELIGVRRRHPWLATATTETVAIDNTHYRYRVQGKESGQQLDVELDIADTPLATIRDEHGQPLWQYQAQNS